MITIEEIPAPTVAEAVSCFGKDVPVEIWPDHIEPDYYTVGQIPEEIRNREFESIGPATMFRSAVSNGSLPVLRIVLKK